MYFKSFIAAFAVAAMSAGLVSAKTVTAKYEATSAIGSGSNHSVWFSTGLTNAIGKNFDFTPAGIMTLFSDGTASLIGRVISRKRSGAWFDLSFGYDNTFLQAPTFKSENGSVETASTFYRDLEGGTLIGGGILAGLNLSVSRLPANGYYATQIGGGTATNNGANNKNKNFGMANWFKINVDSASCKICYNRRGKAKGFVRKLQGSQGDVNVDLTPVPLPAAGLLMVGALGALGSLRRRKRKAA